MNKTLKRSIITAILAAISCVLYSFPKFPLPFFPSFLEINFSMLAIFIAGFVLGPKEGLIVVLIRFLVKLLIISSHTAGVGEIADLIMGAVIILPTSIVFQNSKKTTKSLLMSLLLGLGVWVLAGVLSNALLSVPLYLKLYFGGNVNALCGALSILPGEVTASNYMWKYLLFAVVPFNLIIGVVVTTVTFFVYKCLNKFFESTDFDKESVSNEKTESN